MGAGFVKRLQRDKGCVHIISDNKIYKETTESGESDDFLVVGKVRYVVHKVQGGVEILSFCGDYIFT